MTPIKFVCPNDRSALVRRGRRTACLKSGHIYPTHKGIPIFINPDNGSKWEMAIDGHRKNLNEIFSKRIAMGNGWWVHQPKTCHEQLKHDYVFSNGRARIIDEIVSRGPNIVLDSGGGEGFVTRELRKRYKKKNVTYLCSDLSNDFLEQGKKKDKDVVFFCADSRHLPLENKAVDSIFSAEVLEHIPDTYGLAREINRVLIKGGVFIASTPNAKGLALDIDERIMEFVLMVLRRITGRKDQPIHKKIKPPDYEIFLTSSKLKRKFIKAGFSSVRIDFVQILPEAYFALMNDLGVPLSITRLLMNFFRSVERLMPNFIKEYLCFTQVLVATK